jgi:hypothetical protein
MFSLVATRYVYLCWSFFFYEIKLDRFFNPSVSFERGGF